MNFLSSWFHRVGFSFPVTRGAEDVVCADSRCEGFSIFSFLLEQMSEPLSDAELLDRCFALISSHAAYGEALSELATMPLKSRRTGTAALERDVALEQVMMMKPANPSQSQSLIDVMNQALLKVLAGKHPSEKGLEEEANQDDDDENHGEPRSGSTEPTLARKWRTLLKDRARLQGFALGMESATLATFERNTPSALAALHADQDRRLANLMSNCRPPLVYSAKKGDAWNSVLDKGQFYYFEEMGHLRAGAHAVADMDDVWEVLNDHLSCQGRKTSSTGSIPPVSIQQELTSVGQCDKTRRSSLQLCWNIVHHFARREDTPEGERLHQGQYLLSRISSQTKKTSPTTKSLQGTTPPAPPLASSAGPNAFDAWLDARQFSKDTIPPSLRPGFYSFLLFGGSGQETGADTVVEPGTVPWELALAYEAHSVAQLQDYFIFSGNCRRLRKEWMMPCGSRYSAS